MRNNFDLSLVRYEATHAIILNSRFRKRRWPQSCIMWGHVSRLSWGIKRILSRNMLEVALLQATFMPLCLSRSASECEVFSLKIFLLRWNFALPKSSCQRTSATEKSRQHPRHFPTSPLGQYYAGSSLLNFGGWKRSGVFRKLWPSAMFKIIIAKVFALQQQQPIL